MTERRGVVVQFGRKTSQTTVPGAVEMTLAVPNRMIDAHRKGPARAALAN
jgi:hypothetical protein